MPERALPAIFFLSGVAALVFETLWFRQASLAVGSTVWASSIVLASFMAGLALGGAIGARVAPRLRRPLVAYAAIEVVIAAVGVVVVLALPRLAGWFAGAFRALEGGPGQDALRLGLSFACLALPATAMGLTLPVLARALSERDPCAGAVIGRLYGWNTLGAVAGSLLAETCTIAWFGVRGSALLAGALDLVAAGLAVALARGLAAGAGPEATAAAAPLAPARALDRGAARLLLAAGLAGATMLALEVVWLRVVLLRVFGTSLVFAAILGGVLAGIGAGGLLAAALLRRRPGAHAAAGPVASLAGAALVAAYVATLPLEPSNSRLGVALLGTAPLLPVALASGALFVLLGAALGEELGDASRAAGLLGLANTLGAIAGALLGGFVLLPLLGPERAAFLLALSWGLVACVLLRLERGPARAAAIGAGLLLAGALLVFPHGAWEGLLLRPVLGEPVVVARDGLNETIRYTSDQAHGEVRWVRLCTNSHSMSSTMDRSRRYMKLYAWWPMALHPAPRSALLISFGCGVTARALCDIDTLERIDIADTSRDVLELSRIPFPDPARDPLRDPRAVVHVEDGRFFLQTSDRRWDIITSEPPPPTGAGVVNLYTREHFELIRERLTDGGVCTYWLPVHALSEPGTKAIVAAFLAAFDDASLWSGSRLDLMLVGTRGLRGPVDEAHARRPWTLPAVERELAATGVDRPEDLGATFLFDADGLRELVGDTPPVTDDFPSRLQPDARSTSEEDWRIFGPWIDPGPARQRFRRSPLIARVWPPGLVEPTLAAFEHQPTLNALGDGGALLLPELHAAVLRRGPRLLALSILGTSVDEERLLARALARGLRRDPAIEWALAASAIADRRWEAAEQHLRRSVEAPPDRLLPLLAWVLCLRGDLDGARAVPRAGPPHLWAWLDQTFGLGLAAPGPVGPGR